MRASRASIRAWGAAGLLLADVAPPAEAYIGPGAGFALLSSFFVVFTTIILAALSLLTLAACSGRDEAAERVKVEDAVRRSIEAENAGDAATFLSLWTDDGLRSYDAGTRDELTSGLVRLGAEQTELRGFASTVVKGDQAAATIDGRVELGLYRSRFDLVRRDGRWLLDGFRFLGPTPVPAGAPRRSQPT